MDEGNNVKYSLIFLDYDPKGIKDWTEATKANIKQMASGYDYEFIEVKDVEGYVCAVNEGLKRARGEYLVVLNDDVIVKDSDWLSKLANENAITSWKEQEFYMNRERMPDGACWCVHRNVYEEIGGMDERYKDGYGCDEIDYFYTAREAGFDLVIEDIDIDHMENKTYLSEYFIKDKSEMTTRNTHIFYEKWKDKMDIQV